MAADFAKRRQQLPLPATPAKFSQLTRQQLGDLLRVQTKPTLLGQHAKVVRPSLEQQRQPSRSNGLEESQQDVYGTEQTEAGANARRQAYAHQGRDVNHNFEQSGHVTPNARYEDSGNQQYGLSPTALRHAPENHSASRYENALSDEGDSVLHDIDGVMGSIAAGMGYNPTPDAYDHTAPLFRGGANSYPTTTDGNEAEEASEASYSDVEHLDDDGDHPQEHTIELLEPLPSAYQEHLEEQGAVQHIRNLNQDYRAREHAQAQQQPSQVVSAQGHEPAPQARPILVQTLNAHASLNQPSLPDAQSVKPSTVESQHKEHHTVESNITQAPSMRPPKQKHEQARHSHQPDISKQAENFTISTPRTQTISTPSRLNLQIDDLDYPQHDLPTMPFPQLRDEPFDKPPHETTPILSTDLLTAPLPTQLTHVSTLPPDMQTRFFASLSLPDWEAAGDWFTAQHGQLTDKLRTSRRERRALAQAFEAGVAERHEVVSRERGSLDEVLGQMRQNGVLVIRQSTPKRKRV